MLWVIDKKIVQHLIDSDGGLLEMPVRVSFEYAIDDGRFRAHTLTRKVLYNIDAALRRCPSLARTKLEDDVAATVDAAIEEHLRFAGLIEGSVELFEPAVEPAPDPPAKPPKLILP